MADPARKLRTCQEKQAKREAEAMVRASLFVFPPKRGGVAYHSIRKSLESGGLSIIRINCSICMYIYIYVVYIMSLSIIIPTYSCYI